MRILFMASNRKKIVEAIKETYKNFVEKMKISKEKHDKIENFIFLIDNNLIDFRFNDAKDRAYGYYDNTEICVYKKNDVIYCCFSKLNDSRYFNINSYLNIHSTDYDCLISSTDAYINNIDVLLSELYYKIFKEVNNDRH